MIDWTNMHYGNFFVMWEQYAPIMVILKKEKSLKYAANWVLYTYNTGKYLLVVPMRLKF